MVKKRSNNPYGSLSAACAKEYADREHWRKGWVADIDELKNQRKYFV